jgi:hypothetical protein
MAIYMHLYLPVLVTCGLMTAAGVVNWMMNSGDIDLGPPNARI